MHVPVFWLMNRFSNYQTVKHSKRKKITFIELKTEWARCDVDICRLEVLEQNSSTWIFTDRYNNVTANTVSKTYTNLDVNRLFSFRVNVIRSEEGGKLMSESTPGFPTPFFSTVCGGKGQGKGTKPKTNVNLLYIIFGNIRRLTRRSWSFAMISPVLCFQPLPLPRLPPLQRLEPLPLYNPTTAQLVSL